MYSTKKLFETINEGLILQSNRTEKNYSYVPSDDSYTCLIDAMWGLRTKHREHLPAYAALVMVEHMRLTNKPKKYFDKAFSKYKGNIQNRFYHLSKFNLGGIYLRISFYLIKRDIHVIKKLK